MATPPHIQAAYARYARDYCRLPTVPNPRPEGWIDLFHVPVHRGYATAVKKMLFEAHHAHLFDWKAAPITFAPLEIPGFHEVRFRQRDAIHAQRGRLALLIPRQFTNVIHRSDLRTETLFVAVAKPLPVVGQAVQAVVQPAARPAGRVVAQPNTQPINQPAVQPIVRSAPRQVIWPVAQPSALVSKQSDPLVREELVRPVQKPNQRLNPSKKRPHREIQEHTPEISARRYKTAKKDHQGDTSSSNGRAWLENSANFIGSDRLFEKKLKEMTAISASSSGSRQVATQSLPSMPQTGSPQKRARNSSVSSCGTSIPSLNQNQQYLPSMGPAHSPEKKGKNGGWSSYETSALEKALKDIRAEEKEQGVQEIMKDTVLWNEASRRILVSHGIDRSGAACRSHWSRNGRAESGFDERFKKNPSMLATCLQKPKGGK